MTAISCMAVGTIWPSLWRGTRCHAIRDGRRLANLGGDASWVVVEMLGGGMQKRGQHGDGLQWPPSILPSSDVNVMPAAEPHCTPYQVHVNLLRPPKDALQRVFTSQKHANAFPAQARPRLAPSRAGRRLGKVAFFACLPWPLAPHRRHCRRAGRGW